MHLSTDMHKGSLQPAKRLVRVNVLQGQKSIANGFALVPSLYWLMGASIW